MRAAGKDRRNRPKTAPAKDNKEEMSQTTDDKKPAGISPGGLLVPIRNGL